mmetsp:Transcript_20025/g.32344  ORF Transcript_20025/g.32344 Transcript_20025/m.32344 type:complete len:128 (+) Transcript_20025:107-490(+)
MSLRFQRESPCVKGLPVRNQTRERGESDQDQDQAQQNEGKVVGNVVVLRLVEAEEEKNTQEEADPLTRGAAAAIVELGAAVAVHTRPRLNFVEKIRPFKVLERQSNSEKEDWSNPFLLASHSNPVRK